MCGFKFISIEEVASKLIHEKRFAISWCINNDITIHTIGNKKVVDEFEFKCAFEKPRIDDLKRKYGEHWEEVYRLENSEDVVGFIKMEPMLGLGKNKVLSNFNANDLFKKLRLSGFTNS